MTLEHKFQAGDAPAPVPAAAASRAVLCAFADEAGAALDAQIAALVENGISAIELRGVDGKNVADLTPSEADAVRRRLDAAGIAVWSIGSPIGKVPLAGKADAEVARFEKILDTACRLGASCLRLFSFYEADTSPAAYDRTLAAVVERLDRFLTLASPTGVLLCHENEKGIFGDIPERCLALHRALPALAAVFDPANFIQCGVDPAAAWPQLAPYVRYLHIKDALPDGTVVPAGYGVGSLPAIIGDYLARENARTKDAYKGNAGKECDGEKRVLTLEPHLFAFKGLGALSASDEAGILASTRFATDREAFDFAVGALKKLLGEK